MPGSWSEAKFTHLEKLQGPPPSGKWDVTYCGIWAGIPPLSPPGRSKIQATDSWRCWWVTDLASTCPCRYQVVGRHRPSHHTPDQRRERFGTLIIFKMKYYHGRAMDFLSWLTSVMLWCNKEWNAELWALPLQLLLGHLFFCFLFVEVISSCRRVFPDFRCSLNDWEQGIAVDTTPLLKAQIGYIAVNWSIRQDIFIPKRVRSSCEVGAT